MTIAISIKVNDGVVLATDSASTIINNNPNGTTGVLNIYDNANKLYNLHKELPIGAITWGAGSIGQESISTIAKNFRKLISDDPTKKIDLANYSIQNIAEKFKAHVFDNLYNQAFANWPQKPSLGFIVAGYSSGQRLAEEYRFDINNGTCTGPVIVRGQDQIGVTWNGEPEAISRLYLGFGTGLPQVLQQSGIDPALIPNLINNIKQKLTVPMAIPPMPIQDAIDLAQFLVETTIKFSKFAPGAPTVGGPIDIAAITRFEGFKWIKRKHYYENKFNQ